MRDPLPEAGPRPRLLIGVGNLDAGDDAAGRLVARRLAEHAAGAGLTLVECGGEAANLIAAWSGFEEVVLVDACRGAGEPGSVHRLEGRQLQRLAALQPPARGSTHGLGVCAAIALAGALQALPRRLVVYAVEGRRFGAGQPPSPEVERATGELAALLARELGPPAAAAAETEG